MINVETIGEANLLSIYRSRKTDSQSAAEAIKKTFDTNVRDWEAKPEWLARVPAKRSKVRDPRSFLATESQINKLTARPVKPMVLAANESADSKEVATDLQDYLLEFYRTRGVKKVFKRGLRGLHHTRLFSVKMFWNSEIDDMDIAWVDPRKLRVSKNASCEKESEFCIENIDTKRLLDLLALFPDEKEKILKGAGLSEKDAQLKNPPVEYEEMHIGDGVFWVYKNEVLKPIRDPYWDFDGILLTPAEKAQIEDRDQKTGLPTMNGRRRRLAFQKFKQNQGDIQQAIKQNPEEAGKYEAYLYNYFDKRRKPYIFGTVLEVEDGPTGRTSLIEMVHSLQENIDKRKRQISDNADTVNGVTKVDTSIVTMSLAHAQQAHHDPAGLIYGAGVNNGVTRETGKELPAMVFQDLQDSRNELDDIFGTSATFRGSEKGGSETATGRAILREEGNSRLDEFVTLIDYIGQEVYSWCIQFIKVKYTVSHLAKGIGIGKAQRAIEIMQDDVDGVELKVMPGQTLPEDLIYKSERAAEDLKAGVIDPVTYLESLGGYENPKEVVKKAAMFRASPFTIVDMTDKDIADLQKGLQILAMATPQGPADKVSESISFKDLPPDGQVQMAKKVGIVIGGTATPGTAPAEADKVANVAEVRKRIETITADPAFQKLPPDQQKAKLGEMRSALQALAGNAQPQP